MNDLITLGVLAFLPVLLIVLLRVNGALAFMSLCVGSVLVTYTSTDVISVASGLAAKPSAPTAQVTHITLLVLPLVLTLLFTRKSVKRSKFLLNLLPAIATGLLFALLVVPLLSGGVRYAIVHLPAWHQLNNLQTSVVLGGALLSLFYLLVTHRAMRRAEAKRGKSAKE